MSLCKCATVCPVPHGKFASPARVWYNTPIQPTGGMFLRTLTVYPWHTGKLSHPLRLMVVSDLHDGPYEDILPMLVGADALLVPGDVVNRYQQSYSRGFSFVREASALLPTFIGVGNHEIKLRNFRDFRAAVEQTDATFLFNSYIRFGELAIGCWYRPERYGHVDILPELEAEMSCKILLCHRPEDYIHRLKGANIDLVLAGHAHGGQIRVRDRGLYAPGQGILPKYTHGVVDGRMIISAGASNAVAAPRWGNPCEVLQIDID